MRQTEVKMDSETDITKATRKKDKNKGGQNDQDGTQIERKKTNKDNYNRRANANKDRHEKKNK